MATNADSDYINNLMKDYNTLAEEFGNSQILELLWIC